MTETLTEEQKETIQTASLYLQEAKNQKELLEMKRKAKTSKDHFDILFKELGRPVCNKCQAAIRLYEMASFNRNGGHCNNCSA